MAEQTALALRPQEELPAAMEAPHAELPAVTGDPYRGIAQLQLSPEQAHELAERIPVEDLDIKPTGEVYASQIRYRRILNRVFGPGRWALMARSPWSRQDNTVCREFALYVDGHFVAEAVGEQDYIANNPNMSWATATEGAKSNALVRACKDLGIASECWDRRFTEQFKAEHCVQVWVDGKPKPQWRRKDAPAFYKERGPVSDAPPPSPEHDARSAQPRPPQQSGNTQVISEPQRKRMYAIWSNAGHKEADVKAWLQMEYGFASSKDVTRSKYNEICARLESRVPLAEEVGEVGNGEEDIPF